MATRVDKSEPLVAPWDRAVRRATGKARATAACGLDRRDHLAHGARHTDRTCGQGNRLIPHQVDEYGEVGELIDAARIYVASATGVPGS